MKKIALAIICKGSAEEAKVLDRCLGFVSPYVTDTFVTITHKPGEERNKEVEKVCNSWDVKISDFEWCNDFSAARNFNFSQVSKEYNYILWCDADDGIRGLEHLHDVLEQNSDVDMFSMNYLYAFNEYKQPTVVHIKNQIIKNNGCVEWFGALHEDFRELRSVKRLFIKEIERIHLADDERTAESRKRNVIVAKAALDKDRTDPRLWWNYGNSLMGNGKYEESRNALVRFSEMSNSDDEKYIAYVRLANIAEFLGDKKMAVIYGQTAIGLKPLYPDAYHTLGQIYYNRSMYQLAVEMISQGLVKQPPYYSILVYNPRDYDFHPMMLLAKTFFNMSRPDQAVTCLQACQTMQPGNKEVEGMLKVLLDKKQIFDEVIDIIERLQKITDKKKLKKELDKLPEHLQSNPSICAIRNTNFIKETSSGKDLVIYAGYTEFPWSPSYAKKKGVGGSEEAVLNLAKEWQKMGWNVTVYCNTPDLAEEADGVHYKPFWEWNYRDKQDIVILWRQVKPVDYGINATRILIDLHDVIQPGEFTEERLEKIHKIMVKTKFHRDFIPKVSDEKIAIVPNGIDFELFDEKECANCGKRAGVDKSGKFKGKCSNCGCSTRIKKDRYLLVNTSSPDRSMDVLPMLFKKIKQQIPEVRMVWAYGFDLFDKFHDGHAVMLDWSTKTKEAMKDAGIENLGRLTQKECAKLYLEGNMLVYPTEFAEIDCITVKKAQACGCMPITTDFGALDESVQHGVKIHSTKTKDTWAKPNQFHFGLEDKKAQDEWVAAVVAQLKKPIGSRAIMKKWAKKFEWSKIASRWEEFMV